ncbi:MAG: MarR family transcriptional regulator [Planctomycetota bacterium]
MALEQALGDSEAMTDRSLIDFLRRQGESSISELVDFAGVTATAIRQRLGRLMDQGLVERTAEPGRRGRPTHRYALTAAGVRVGGDNYEDLASVLWSEIRAVEDPDVRHGLLRRIVSRLADSYRDQVVGQGLREKMESLVQLMLERDVRFEVSEVKDGELPVLTALACPYPDLAEQDRSICSMEKMLFSEILGESVRLSACRLDGENCCTFEARTPTASPNPATI